MDEQVKTTARARMQGFCRVCSRCDGRACAGQVPGMGGTGSASSFKQNLKALEHIKIEMRTMHAVHHAETGLELFGRKLSMPILVSPLGGVQYNMTARLTEHEYIASMTEGANQAGTLCGTGDGEVPEIFEAAMQAFSSCPHSTLPFIKPWAQSQLEQRLEQLQAAGADVCGMDVDAAGLITLKALGQPVYPKTPKELQQIIGSAGMSFILKGVMTADEAKIAVDAGAAAIVVSNHGGRVLDYTPGTAEVLPEIVQAVNGAVPVLVDGGVRSGTDVFKMLSLGARAVMIGRPAAIAAIGGGAQALTAELAQFREELRQVMVVTGAADLDAINGEHIRRM
ncbi:MAG: alpha-hydroxy-acid oxidizing protein [Spirochaetota bacterium]